MSTAKAEMIELLDALPDDCTPEDIEQHLSIREQIGQGIWSVENEPACTHRKGGQSLSRSRTADDPDAELRAALDAITTCSAKAEVLAALAELPDQCTLDDVREQLYEREQLRQGLASALYEPRVSQEDVEAWIDRWERE